MSEINETGGNNQNTSHSPDDLTLQLVNFLRNSLNLQPSNANTNSDNLSIGFKLNGDNYPLWATLMRKAIGGRGRASHITGVPPPPSNSDPSFTLWDQNDQCVFTWLIQNIESNLVNNVSQYPTAKTLWEGLAVTYGSGVDALQVFDLHRQANTLKQGSHSLEECWNRLQRIWMSIDSREPNPMKDPEDINIYNKIVETRKLYQFLTTIDDRYESIKRDILKREPLPSVEIAYATVRRETARANILRPVDSLPSADTSLGVGAGLVAQNHGAKPEWKPDRNRPPPKGNPPRSGFPSL